MAPQWTPSEKHVSAYLIVDDDDNVAIRHVEKRRKRRLNHLATEVNHPHNRARPRWHGGRLKRKARAPW